MYNGTYITFMRYLNKFVFIGRWNRMFGKIHFLSRIKLEADNEFVMQSFHNKNCIE